MRRPVARQAQLCGPAPRASPAARGPQVPGCSGPHPAQSKEPGSFCHIDILLTPPWSSQGAICVVRMPHKALCGGLAGKARRPWATSCRPRNAA